MQQEKGYEHLHQYISERLPDLVPGVFDDVPDLLDFTVDQRFLGIKSPPYQV